MKAKEYKVKVSLRNGDEVVKDDNVVVSFSYNPDDYGNGYHMGVESKMEPFGFSAYDLRYDPDLDVDYLMTYIVRHYESKSKDWKLDEISIKEIKGEE